MFARVADPYPGVVALGAELGEAATTSFEQRLRDFADHPDTDIRRYFRQIPLYLRDLFIAVTGAYLRGGAAPSNHVRLILRLLQQQHEVVFLDLNYDDFLEKALQHLGLPINGLLDYTAPDRRAIVGKVHGSIHWGRPVEQAPPASAADVLEALISFDPFSPCDTLVFRPDRTITMGWRTDGGQLLYPVLTAPMAGKDHTALVCPIGHLDQLGKAVKDCRHFLVIGTSGQDEDLLGFLGRSVTDVSMVQYVNVSDEVTSGARSCLEKFEEACPAFAAAARREPLDDGFRSYLARQQFQDSLDA